MTTDESVPKDPPGWSFRTRHEFVGVFSYRVYSGLFILTTDESVLKEPPGGAALVNMTSIALMYDMWMIPEACYLHSAATYIAPQASIQDSFLFQIEASL